MDFYMIRMVSIYCIAIIVCGTFGAIIGWVVAKLYHITFGGRDEKQE